MLQGNAAEQETNERNEIDLNAQHPHSQPSEITYQTPELKLIVEKAFHKRQKIFRLDDHLYYIKIIPTNPMNKPLLLDILDFLHAGFIHILDEIKSYYRSEDKNIAYLTLFQQPMLNGLNR